MKFWGESLLLTDQSVEKIFKLYPGSNVMLGDVVVFCFSDVLLIGWWRYLKRIQCFVELYDINVIVLCPAPVYIMNLLRDEEDIVLLNGEMERREVLASIARKLQIRRHGCIKGINRTKTGCVCLPVCRNVLKIMIVVIQSDDTIAVGYPIFGN